MEKLKLSETELKALIAECVKGALNEGTNDSLMVEQWNFLAENRGMEFLDDIFQYLSSDVIQDILYEEWRNGCFEGSEFESYYE